ncbi:hypothetical protein [Streptomyces antnestii]|uniref:hypothetical protein n=1 Tax=Streptomyces antnestii TaxID=2494256 RepID=UPI00167483DF|nr:hypothetical protein [Streptomyces sp. San01]
MANHLRYGDNRPGEHIDIRCGHGIDTILAARRTGPSGPVCSRAGGVMRRSSRRSTFQTVTLLPG